MPIWLRNFTFQSLHDHYTKEREAQESKSQPNKEKSVFKIPKELTYKAKARG